ncbi:MAG: hypothetical protein U5Q44_02275 [Dehalococcoidia bacterium]|nr:hypothetical protein [Dehalococcoidia bacterium]
MILVLVLVLALLQVTAAPFFPIASAQADLLLVTLGMLFVFAGPRRAMIAVPMMAIVLGFLSSRSPALLVLAFLPLPPLAYWLNIAGPPLTRFLQTAMVVLITGAWARGLLGLAAIAQGADAAFGTMIVHIILPGMVLDGLFLSLAYLPARLIGWEPRSTSPLRERYQV